ncbi:uncharacterized protein CLUP02_16830 [Colletotrichum lupini]|uniref:Uncharacterized protein n=2 Tax=Colletotrichum acutatum species complex TaxID=2707335 RepID=A0A9Q8WQ19_9PEZI|nr:uncharacterized protein CLUP02_16830 [Colletotrichum lupini]XP_060373720.1 uncharacterized protein CTAM01_15719 [Colletotrichum tamarilloi]KAK1475150.1 hypothetical protein CTAM01_15719 [Colletotrichum tamarilloi]UQC91296.1 hypothetical protein CLUP02_16830 [Colletotrichum lupini]
MPISDGVVEHRCSRSVFPSKFFAKTNCRGLYALFQCYTCVSLISYGRRSCGCADSNLK